MGMSAESSGMGSSVNVSQEKLGHESEKVARFADLPKISSEVTAVIKFRAGRAGLREILEEDVSKAQTTMGVAGESAIVSWRLIADQSSLRSHGSEPRHTARGPRGQLAQEGAARSGED